jgi:ATP-dependent DNA ligase
MARSSRWTSRTDLISICYKTSGPPAKQINYFVFDLLVLNGEDLTRLAVIERRNRLLSLTFSAPLIRLCEQFEPSSEEMITAVRQESEPPLTTIPA